MSQRRVSDDRRLPPSAGSLPEGERPPAEMPRKWYQYSLASLLLLMAVVSVLASALAGVLGTHDAQAPRWLFVAMLIAAPMGLMIALSLWVAARRWLDRKR